MLLVQGLDTALLEIAIWGVGQPAIANVLESLPITFGSCAPIAWLGRTHTTDFTACLLFFALRGEKEQTKR